MTVKRKFILDDEKINLFLEELRRTGLVATSARSVGTNSRTINRAIENDQEFAEAYEEALLEYQELLQAEMHRRAVEGVEEEVYFQGVPVGTKTVYSDSLLATLTKAKVPEFRDKQKLDVAVSGGVLLTLPPAQSPEQWLESTEIAGELPAPKEEIEEADIIDVELEPSER